MASFAETRLGGRKVFIIVQPSRAGCSHQSAPPPPRWTCKVVDWEIRLGVGGIPFGNTCLRLPLPTEPLITDPLYPSRFGPR